MSKYSVLIVEDEAIVSKDIQQSLKKLGYTIAGACSKAEDAIMAAKERAPDLVLMDIMLKGSKTGIEAAEIIRKTTNIPTVFLTAYADENTLEKAKRAEPYGYILKPFRENELRSVIEVAVHKHQKVCELVYARELVKNQIQQSSLSQEQDVLFVKHNGRVVRVDYTEICFVEALKDYVAINTESSKYVVHITMKEIERRLTNPDFLRAHRSFIVRKDKIIAIEDHHLILKNDKKAIPVGGLYKHSVYDALNLI